MKKGEERARGPRLGRAGDGIAGRSAVSEPRKAAKKLGQALQIEIARGFEKSAEYSRDFALCAVARQSQRDQRVVVRPDRAIVVGHRVVASLGGGDRPNAP